MPVVIVSPQSSFNTGINRALKRQDNIKAIKQIISDSRKKSQINCHLDEPITFRTPISFALSDEPAVERLTKLKQAINRINTAINEKI
jgi:hypothetical protein